MSIQSTRHRTLGRYDLKEEIGRGGMAVVYRAYDNTLKRDVAIKLLHPHLISHQEARRRFEREAHSVARLNHPGIVAVYDYSETEEGDVFLVMELVDGVTLRQFLEERQMRPLLPECAALIAREIFLALAAAHAEGIVHRDVKPENILISNTGALLLSDFGIAYLAGIGQMTVTGQILGSPAYMSPEHIERAVVDARADIFSVGTVLYEMTVGMLPFVGNNPHQIIKRVVEGYYDHPLSVNPSIGHGVASVIVRCMQQQPERRYASAEEAASELEGYLAQMDVATDKESLAAFFTDPDGFENAIISRIIPRTLELGRLARKARHLPEAMNHFNRVLALDSRNEVALASVNALSRRRQMKRAIERFGLAFLFALAAIIFLFLLLSGRLRPESETDPPKGLTLPELPVTQPSNPPNSEKPLQLVPKTPPASVDSEAVLQLSPTSDNRERPAKKNREEKTETPDLTTREVVFNPFPMGVEIIIDGGERFVYKTTDRSRVLTTGNHRAQFVPRDERLLPLTLDFKVQPGTTVLTIGARLKWKPGQLLVRCNARAEVSVDGRAAGRTNEPLDVSFDEAPSKQVRVIVSGSGFRPVSRQVEVDAGKTVEMVVHLENQPI